MRMLPFVTDATGRSVKVDGQFAKKNLAGGVLTVANIDIDAAHQNCSSNNRTWVAHPKG